MEPPRGEGWQRDPDVLDTWFSSALWPFATLGWPRETPDLRAFYPTDALVTARDIIFLWVARMIMMGLEFTGSEPFSDVYITPIIQAPDGRRMSKSLGTGIDPLDLIEGGPRPPVFAPGSPQPDEAASARSGEAGSRAAGKSAGDFPAYGADAVRWGLLAMSSGQDVSFSEDKVAQGQQLCNKLWNAARLILLGVGTDMRAAVRPNAVEDRWILSRLERARTELAARIEALRLLPCRAGALRLHLRRALRLVPGAGQAPPARRRAGAGGDAAARADRDRRSGPPPDPVRDRGDLLPHPGDRGAAGRAGQRARLDVRPRRPDAAAEDAVQRAIAAVQALRRWRDMTRVPAGATISARLDATGYDETLEHIVRLARLNLHNGAAADPVATIPVPGRSGPDPAERRARPRRRRPAAWRSSAPSWRRRSSGPSASSPTRGSWPRPRRRSCRPSVTSSSGFGRNWIRSRSDA